jgi:ELWxxDGT repeat protein
MRVVTAFTAALALGGAAGSRAQAPYLVKDVYPGTAPGVGPVLVPIGDRVFFTGMAPDTGIELWFSGGTEATTTVLDLAPGSADPWPLAAAAVGDRGLFFYSHPSVPGIWKTDGTVAGTERVSAELFGGILARSRDRVLFVVQAAAGRGPLVTDGTPGATYLIPPPPGGFATEPAFQDAAASFADGFAIALNLGGAWWTDGTPTGTKRLVDAALYCSSATAAGGRLFLNCTLPTGFRLLVSDGTYSGTETILELPLPGLSLLPAGDQVFVMRPGGLWRSDGTPGGTGPVPLPSPTPIVNGPTRDNTAVSGNVLFFAATTPDAGTELWRTDGTASGTFMLRDIEPGPGSGIDSSLELRIRAAAGNVFFAARTTAGGEEVWKTDGTPVGTIPLPEIVPGPGSSSPWGFAAAGGRVFFVASDPAHGSELWAIDVAQGAVAVDDAFVDEGDSGTATARFTVRLESAATLPLVVSYETVAVTAQAGSDFAAQSGTLTFAPGERERTVEVPVFGDVADEANESLKLVLTPVGSTVIADGSAALVIVDDDAPRVRADWTSAVEGDSGLTDAVFGLTIETEGGPTTLPVAVHFAPLAGTATAGSDFDALQGTVTFPAGSASGTTLTATVGVRGDTIDEPNETFTLALDGQNDAEVSGPFPLGTIVDDDGVAAARSVELSHGTSVRADLAPLAGPGPDRDDYALLQQPDASYEVVVDEASGDAAPLTVQRIAADGTTVLQSAAPIGTGTATSLRWLNTASDPFSDQHVRVESASCETACGPDDTYRVRFYETTLRAPRVNNTNGQTTVLLLQNLSDAAVSGRIHFWTEPGTSGTAQPFSVPARGTLVFDTTQITPVTGSLKVVHDAPYGALVGKVVALEPATGFSFDTPLTVRPR